MIQNLTADAALDNKTKILIALPLVLIVILGIGATYIPFQIALSGPEERVLNFKPDNLEISKQKEVIISSNLHSPVDFKLPAAASEPEDKDDLVAELDYNDTDKNLTLTVISGDRKMAVINGSLRKVGETVNGMKIARIEPGKVLLKNKKSQWLYIKDTQ